MESGIAIARPINDRPPTTSEFVGFWDNYFRTPLGSVDLLSMSNRVDPALFRSYIERSRELRAERRKQ